ncbi:hypothetical protein [Streptomyces niveus]|uniref:Uncharacterized protein n=1 Tax=Streptomyces niveus TaxID=193462 RepID=A0ABZ2A767_STRNV|nr:hypothetical protein [Streptomyces niveus]
MIRNIIGSVLAVIGAAGAVASPFQSWYDGRHGRDYRVEDLFNGITGTSSDLWVSLLLPFAFAALVTLLGLVLRSRLLVALSGLIVLGFTILWMVRQGQRSDGLTLNGDGTGIGLGVAAALGGGALLLIAAAVMSGRRSRGGRGSHRYVAGDRTPERYGEYGDTGQVGQVGYDEPEPYRTHQYPPYDAGHPPAGSTEQHAWDDTREQQPWTPPPQPPDDRP